MKKLDVALITEILGIGLVSIGVGMFSVPLAFIVVDTCGHLVSLFCCPNEKSTYNNEGKWNGKHSDPD